MEDLYFRDEATKYIFYLLHIQGKQQLDFLGINPSHYIRSNVAENWFKETKRKIEYSNHPKKDEAMEKLKALYKRMKH